MTQALAVSGTVAKRWVVALIWINSAAMDLQASVPRYLRAFHDSSAFSYCYAFGSAPTKIKLFAANPPKCGSGGFIRSYTILIT